MIAGDAIGRLTLPPTESQIKGTAAVEELLKACAPATFGKKGEEVLDESYRKAVKLDSDQFCTSFNPHEVGIVDAIAQSMLPAIAKPFSDQKSRHEEHLGVIAELYKLNVSAPKVCRRLAHVAPCPESLRLEGLVSIIRHTSTCQRVNSQLILSTGSCDDDWQNWKFRSFSHLLNACHELHADPPS